MCTDWRVTVRIIVLITGINVENTERVELFP